MFQKLTRTPSFVELLPIPALVIRVRIRMVYGHVVDSFVKPT